MIEAITLNSLAYEVSPASAKELSGLLQEKMRQRKKIPFSRVLDFWISRRSCLIVRSLSYFHSGGVV